jgi:hypothetical protein
MRTGLLEHDGLAGPRVGAQVKAIRQDQAVAVLAGRRRGVGQRVVEIRIDRAVRVVALVHVVLLGSPASAVASENDCAG